MLNTGRILHCDRCGEKSIQIAQTVEEKCYNTQLITPPDWPDGWNSVNDWLLCPSCCRKWEHTTRNFFKVTKEENE